MPQPVFAFCCRQRCTYRIDRKAPGVAAISATGAAIKTNSIEYTLPATLGNEEISSYEICDDAQGLSCQTVAAGAFLKNDLLPYKDYTVYAKAIDVAGNKAATFQDITVPHGQSWCCF